MTNGVEIPDASFVRNLLESLKVWVRQPALPIVTMLVWGLPELADLLAIDITDCPSLDAVRCDIPAGVAFWVLFAIPALLFLFLAGWVGAERIWYLRAFGGRTTSVRTAIRFAFRLVGRFVRLGMVVVLVALPFLWVSLTPPQTSAKVITSWAVFVLIDLALTFVTPTLTYTTHRARHAIRIGVAMIGTAWPRSALYVLIPPLALFLVTRTMGPALSPAGSVAIAVLAALVNLAFKGSIARFYLARHGTDPDVGAAYPHDNRASNVPSPRTTPGGADVPPA